MTCSFPKAKFKQINEALIRAVPELRDMYEEEVSAWGEEMGPHVIYGGLLNPYLERLIDAQGDPRADEALRRVFDFLEELLANPDPDFSDGEFSVGY